MRAMRCVDIFDRRAAARSMYDSAVTVSTRVYAALLMFCNKYKRNKDNPIIIVICVIYFFTNTLLFLFQRCCVVMAIDISERDESFSDNYNV